MHIMAVVRVSHRLISNFGSFGLSLDTPGFAKYCMREKFNDSVCPHMSNLICVLVSINSPVSSDSRQENK